MNPTLLRRAAAAAALAAMLSLGLPAPAHALPAPLERLATGIHEAAQSPASFFGRMLRTLCEEAGIGIDPNGRANGDNGSILDPDGGSRTDTGSWIDPDGLR
jgi:hypothetical protein